jgi:hypothetical protein
MRWRTGLRKVATALALGVGAGTLAVLPATPGQAEGPYTFRCQGPLAPDGQVAVNISLSARELAVGQPLVVRWQLGVQSPLKAQDPINDRKLDEGGHLAITGRVRARGVWTGQGTIDASSTRFIEAERLRADENLELGTVADGQVIASRPGIGSIEIGSLVIDLAPAVSVWNNEISDPPRNFGVSYAGSWSNVPDPAGGYGDQFHIEKDVRQTENEGDTASFTFVGTSVDLITDRSHDMGAFELTVDDGYGEVEHRATHSAYWSVEGERRLRQTFETTPLPYGRYTLTVKNKMQGKFARVDAFRVHATTADNSVASPYRTVCTPPANVPLIPITVTDGNPGGEDPDPDPTDTATPTWGPTTTPTGGPTPTGSSTGSPGPNPSGTGGNNTTSPGNTVLVTATVSPSPRPTQTVTSTVTASPQVRITPVGAAQTGEAPASGPSPGALIAFGAALLTGGVLGGVALRRRRAAHAGDRPGPTS